MKDFTFYKQLNAMDCGPTCVRMVAKSYGKHYNTDTLRQIAGFGKQGVSLLGISDTAEKIGFRTRGVKVTLKQLMEAPNPSILHWNQNHFVVLVSITGKIAKVADPSKGIIKYNLVQFEQYWAVSKNGKDDDVGIALLLEPAAAFFEAKDQKEIKLSWTLAIQYLRNSNWQLTQVFITLLITSTLSLIFPFLTQSIVDIGINTQNLQYVVIILIAQLMLTFSNVFVGFIRSRLLLKVSNILNLQILSDFWIKLTRLPLSYFGAHHTGDTLQRIKDHRILQDFLTGNALITIFSVLNFIVYAVVLMIFSVQLLLVFIAGSIIYFIWIKLFLKTRRKINYETFHLTAKENNATLQLIHGMQEIRLHNAEKQQRWEWENIQANIFKLSFKNLNFSQIQVAGATFINQVSGLIISFIVAKLVIEGTLTLGTMLAVQYIIGQLSAPVQQWVGFVQGYQDAKISMERLNEIHQLSDEQDNDKSYIKQLAESTSILLSNVSFTYPGAGNNPVLENIDLFIPANKITAIVGTSGSGKTTLIKLLLKIHEQYDGEIKIGSGSIQDKKEGLNFRYIDHQYWRSVCGAVLQDSFIFNDSIAKNIAIGEDNIEYDRLIKSCQIANIHSFIESLPNGYYTKLGAEGIGISQGQRQRIFIARAVYKNPEYIFFDEATNSLDANNEKEILENLQKFFQGRTVIVAAHRLSTVKNADKIIVLEKGIIVEEGTHEELSSSKGRYYTLIRNQLELGSA